MLVLTSITIAIIIQLSNSYCYPANVCEGSIGFYSWRSSVGSSQQYICQDDGTICLAYYDNKDCTGDYSNCTTVSESDEMYDIIQCTGCTSYAKIRYHYVNKSCIVKSEDDYYESVISTGCVDVDSDTDDFDFGGNSQSFSCNDTSYTRTAYQETDCDDRIKDATVYEGCGGMSIMTSNATIVFNGNIFGYVDILYCASESHIDIVTIEPIQQLSPQPSPQPTGLPSDLRSESRVNKPVLIFYLLLLLFVVFRIE